MGARWIASAFPWRDREVNSTRERENVKYRIDRDELAAFISRQVAQLEAMPIEGRLGQSETCEPEAMDQATLEAVWLAAAIAAFIGQAICDEPERFIQERGPLHAA